MRINNTGLRAVLAAGIVATVAACASLDVSNPNAPDRTRALGSAADITSLLSGAYYNWYFATQDFAPSLTTGAMANTNTISWGNWGARFYSSVPRRGFQNDPTDNNSNVLTEVPWYNDYSALVAANLSITQANDPAVFDTSADAQAASKMLITASEFIQGATLANIAMYFNQGFFVDENSVAGADVPFLSADKLRDSALKKFDKAIADAGANSFQLPTSFLNTTGWTNTQLAQVANTEAARLLTYFPRTSAEQAAMSPADWARIEAYARAGISTGSAFAPSIEGNNANWYDGYKYLGEDWDTWVRVNQRVVNELDPSQPTTYAYTCPMVSADCSTNAAPQPVSSDQRYDPTPRSDASAGSLSTADFIYVTYDNFNADRGRYHFSQVGHNRYAYHGDLAADGGGFGVVPFILPAENDLILAEALVRQGGAARFLEAANLINKTRVGRGGLPALNGVADVTTAGLAPMYGGYDYNATGEAQTLLRAIFYERDIELMNSSAVTPFYDARRTDRFTHFSVSAPGDLVDTPVQFPVPAKELSALGDELYTTIGTDSVSGETSSLRVRGGTLGGGSAMVSRSGTTMYRVGNRYVGVGRVQAIAEDLRKQSRALALSRPIF